MNSLLIAHALNGLLMIALPVGLGIYLTRRFHLGWRLFWIGAVTFILSQVLHIPFNGLLSLVFLRGYLPMPSLLVNAILLGLSAGIFEEVARYLVYRFWAKDARTWEAGILLGAGHGGIEAILLGLLVLLTYVQMLALQGGDLTQLVPANQLAAAQQAVTQYWSIAWYEALLGAVERLFTIPFHLAASVLVLQVFTRRQIRWLWVAIGWHALLDAAIAGYVVRVWGPYLSEALLGVTALCNLVLLWALRPTVTPPEPDLPGPQAPVEVAIAPPEESPADLENTRFN